MKNGFQLRKYYNNLVRPPHQVVSNTGSIIYNKIDKNQYMKHQS